MAESVRRAHGSLMIGGRLRRNPDRFPPDFMFELNAEETENLRSQNVIPSSHGGSRHGHLAFTEQGVAMLSSVLRSDRAVQVNIAIMRAFVRLREMLGTNADQHILPLITPISVIWDFDAFMFLAEPAP